MDGAKGLSADVRRERRRILRLMQVMADGPQANDHAGMSKGQRMTARKSCQMALVLALTLPGLALAAEGGSSNGSKNSHPGEVRVLVCKDVGKEANKGAVVGGVAGGVLGNVVAGHGSKTAGTVIGAGVGAITGHQIAKKNAKKNQECHYEYRPAPPHGG